MFLNFTKLRRIGYVVKSTETEDGQEGVYIHAAEANPPLWDALREAVKMARLDEPYATMAMEKMEMELQEAHVWQIGVDKEPLVFRRTATTRSLRQPRSKDAKKA